MSIHVLRMCMLSASAGAFLYSKTQSQSGFLATLVALGLLIWLGDSKENQAKNSSFWLLLEQPVGSRMNTHDKVITFLHGLAVVVVVVVTRFLPRDGVMAEVG